MKKDDARPSGYQYFNILKKHLGSSLQAVFSGSLIYPRQLEIHLPADHRKHCNFNCFFCQGRLLKRALYPYELEALELFNNLKGKIPYFIFGGAYSEPTMNPHMMTFLTTTKKYGSHFGIHTNGSLLKTLEKSQGWLTELCRIATDGDDYLSISLDAGTARSHSLTKHLKNNWFDEVIEGIRTAVKIRGKRKKPAIRVCYLLNKVNSSEEEIKTIVRLMTDIKVDSLRFSIPYDLYGKNFQKVKIYKKQVEIMQNHSYANLLAPFLSEGNREKPYIFYLPPDYQDVEKMNYHQCIYSYYQITLGADGYVYKCSSSATPSFKKNRLGKITGNLEEFNKMILRNHSPYFNPTVCFKAGARCNRMALEINQQWKKLHG